MTHFLKYVAVRFFLGTFVAVFAVYGLLEWVHEALYPGRGIDDTPVILWSYPAVLLAVSVLLSLWGRWRFGRIMSAELDNLRREYHPRFLVRAYHRLMRFLESGYFFNTSRRKLARVAASRFGEILLGMRIEDEQALAIYEEVLEREPDNPRYYDFTIRAYSRRSRLSEPSFNSLRRRYHELPDDRLVPILAREYTLRRKLNFESERVLERCVKLYPKFKARVLDFVLPRLVAYQRTDDNAALFYLAAAEAGRGGSEVAAMLRRLEAHYRDKGRADALAVRLSRVLHDYKIPDDGHLEAGGTAKAEGQAAEPETESATLELVGLDNAGEGYGHAAPDEPGGWKRMSLDSRLHGLAQRAFAGGGPTVGGFWKRFAWVILALALAGSVWFARPVARRVLIAFGERGQPYIIQVGAFSDSLKALDLRQRLVNQSVNSYIVSGWAGGSPIYKVRLGGFGSDSAAARTARELLAQRLISEWQVLPVENRTR